jgi:translocation and assembly module TamA
MRPGLARCLRHCRVALPAALAVLLAVATEARNALPTIGYEVVIEGPVDAELRGFLEAVSESRRLTERPPASFVILRRRVADDRPRLRQALNSRGYYAAEVDFRIEIDTLPVRVVFDVDPGEVYRLERVEIRVLPPSDGYRAPAPEALGLAEGAPAESRAILEGEARLLREARNAGHALAALGPREAIVDHDLAIMELTLAIAPGPQAFIGPIGVEGLESVREDFVRTRSGLREGALYSPRALEQARRDLLDAGLFGTASVVAGDELDEEGRLPVTLEVTERRHRSIGGGLRYRSDEGPGVNVFWEHRNILGRGERLALDLDVSGIGATFDTRFRKPDFRRRDQTLLLQANTGVLDTDAFRSRLITLGVGVERRIRPGMSASVGVTARSGDVRSAGTLTNIGLLGLPVTFDWDRSDDLLDPTSGGRLALQTTPFYELVEQVPFQRFVARYSHYLRVTEQPRVVLAGRVALGTIVGAARDQVPAIERFYAGGGGSVRGIGFQLASPLDARNRPLGGRSLLEAALEARVRLTETIGFALFVDAGGAFEKPWPDFSGGLQLGAGAGLRYHTPIGPVRLDVGVPLDRRPVDDAFQIYVSLGQAF